MDESRITSDLINFQEQLLGWFKENKRDLPWRKSYDPYHVWISEIMLQQTQMDRGVAYFSRWIERFPQVEDVAVADEQEILKMWEGLGYYTRARNLHKAAKMISSLHSGVVPDNVSGLKALPGVGPYTAAAIASVASNVDVAAVDANVIRIIARLLDIEKPVKETRVSKFINEFAEKILPTGQARFWNQALMDLGGAVCTPKNPCCDLCPIHKYCLAYTNGTTALRPLPAPKKKIKKLKRVGLLLIAGGKLAICKCGGENNLWKGLWEFPTIDLKNNQTPEEGCSKLLDELTGVQDEAEIIAVVNHSYTTNKVEFYSFLKILDSTDKISGHLLWCHGVQLKEYGFAAGTRKTLEYVVEQRPDIIDLLD